MTVYFAELRTYKNALTTENLKQEVKDLEQEVKKLMYHPVLVHFYKVLGSSCRAQIGVQTVILRWTWQMFFRTKTHEED